ncbi:MAG: DUF6172 family protein [Mariprofundaceae bacterium]|nr:DUF6172 family protein [Mariprofundaceae bacterium]
MKKTFTLTHPKTKAARLADAVRCDVKRYLKRECKKELPKGFDQWQFDCKFGPTAEESIVVDVAELGKCISSAEEQQLSSFYMEIVAKPGSDPKK